LVGKEFGRGPQKKNKEITKSDPISIALTAVHGVDYLLTWNYRHIDNAEKKPSIRKVCLANGYGYPEICTPQELMGVYGNG
jgi:hypothetical protein